MFNTGSRDHDPKYKQWAKDIKARDKYRCQLCKKKGVLHAHHLNSWSAFPDQRYDLSNGITLCDYCHDRFHFVYELHNNTREQFNEFRETYKVLDELVRNKVQKVRDIKERLLHHPDGYKSI